MYYGCCFCYAYAISVIVMNDIYQILMKIGSLTGYHQLPERSIFIKGHQLPPCARCTGIIIGEIAAIPLWFFILSALYPPLSLAYRWW